MHISNIILPYNEVKLWEGQHDDTKERGEGSVSHRGKHMLQSEMSPPISTSYTGHKPLKQY